MIVDVCHCIAGIGDECVRQLSQWTLENEHKQLLQNIAGLKFMENGIKVDHKPFSVGDLMIQFHRIFNLVFFKGFKDLLLVLSFFTVALGIFVLLYDPEMFKSSRKCYPLDSKQPQTNETCGRDVDEYQDSQTYMLFQAFSLIFVGVPITCFGALMFVPLLHAFRNEHRNGKLVFD